MNHRKVMESPFMSILAYIEGYIDRYIEKKYSHLAKDHDVEHGAPLQRGILSSGARSRAPRRDCKEGA